MEGGEDRIAQLEEAILKYPNSPYADDAALLLARAYYFYRDDAEKAIAALYQVIDQYPEGNWIAEDPVMLENVAFYAVGHSDRWRELATKGARLQAEGLNAPSYDDEWQSYLEHLHAHPNRTLDEARFHYAWIIRDARLEGRYEEAERHLRELIDMYRDDTRTQADLRAAQEFDCPLIATRLPRTERTAAIYLIQWLASQERFAEASTSAEQFYQLHAGHSDVESVRHFVINIPAD
jgi:outer membrane protein assembly factor BamD (BamD/ComL family)